MVQLELFIVKIFVIAYACVGFFFKKKYFFLKSFNPECDENMCIAEATPVAVFVWVMMQPAAADAWGWRCVQRGR